jgi:GDP-L-fucose synthase
MTAKTYSLAGKRVWVAGHRGMVGQALLRHLPATGAEILTVGRDRVDLRRQSDVEGWMAEAKPQAVFLAAAKVGGILANDTSPAEFLYDNLMIESHIIHSAWKTGVEKLLFLGSSCIYPKLAPQPLTEDALLTSPLEPTNEWYAIAKIAGIKLCQAYRRQYGCDFISAMPTNLYGYGDLFDLNTSHVIPALMSKAHDAKLSGGKLTVWGTGIPYREFLFSEDLAQGLLFLMQNYSGPGHLNVGTGTDISVADLARLIAEIVGFTGPIDFDRTKPDGTPRKLLDVSRMTGLGWKATTDLKDGLELTYRWFLDNHDTLRGTQEH